MRTSTIALLALLALAAPAAAQAQSKLAIGSIRGDASRVRRQILLQLCDSYECVAATRVVTSDRPDPQKMQRAGVAGYLGGTVTGEPGERRLFLSLTTQASTPSKPARVWRLRLTPDGRLRPQALERFAAELDEAIQGGQKAPPGPVAPPQKPVAPPQKPVPPPQKPVPPPPSPRPPPTVTTPPAAQPPPPPVARPAEKPAEKPRAPARPPSAEGPLRLAGEVGLWITNRKLSWSGATAGADGLLRTYSASAVFVPSLRLELYPGAWVGARPLLAGIGGYMKYGTSFGLKVKPPSGGGSRRTGKLTALDLGVLWRVQPFSGSRFVLAPALAYRSLQVTTSGDAIPGLADTKPSGFELRVDAELPVNPTVRLLAGGGYTMWTAKKEIVGTFFGKGSAHALEVEAGASYRFWGPLSAKAVLEYQSSSYSGLGNPKTTFGTASGASDTYFGGRLMVRAEF